MDVQAIMNQVDATRLAAHRGMRIKEILAILDAAPGDVQVRFDFEYLHPDGFASYRGYYSDLAIGFSEFAQSTCSDFRNGLRECIGETFTGYKGGDNTMNGDTPVWVANYGHTGGTGIVRVSFDDYGVVLHTALIDD